ncbi:MAG TPA: hypothetical protein VIH89_14180 [Candidatus Sulfotelmatobacter sp.]
MKMNIVREVVCCMMIAVLPASLLAADSGAAMVRPYGAAWLNGIAVQQSSAIFPGDLVQTSSSSALKIRTPGSSVTVLSDSAVKFGGREVSVEHGGVQMLTSKGMFARAGIITATPASSGWTEFELTHGNGTVQITALKGDLQISDGSQTTTLPQGQQTTQKDSEQSQNKEETPVPAAKKNRKGVIILAVAGGAAAVAIVAVVASSLASAGTPRSISPITP